MAGVCIIFFNKTNYAVPLRSAVDIFVSRRNEVKKFEYYQ